MCQMEVNFNTATQICANDGRQMNMNSFVQENGQNMTMNQLFGTQVQSSSQLTNSGSYFSGSQFNYPMINTGELRGRIQALLETQSNYSMVYPHINEASIDQGGPNLRG